MWKGMRIYQEVSYRSLIVTKLRIMEYKSHLFFLSRLYKTSNLRMSRLRKIWAKIGADANIKVISPPPPISSLDPSQGKKSFCMNWTQSEGWIWLNPMPILKILLILFILQGSMRTSPSTIWNQILNPQCKPTIRVNSDPI